MSGHDPRLISLAAAALHSAQREDWEQCGKAVNQISGEFGPDGVLTAIIGWCDTLAIAQQEAGLTDLGAARPVWKDADTGRICTDADEMPPRVRWAGQLLAARAALDHATFSALISAVPREETSAYVSTLLTSVAVTLNEITAGAA